MALTKVGINTLKDTAKTVLSESFAEPSAISGSVVSGVSGSVASTGSFGSIYIDKNVNASAFVGDGSSLTGIDIPTAADISGSIVGGVSGSAASTGSFGSIYVGKNVNASSFVGDGSALTGIDIPTAAAISGSFEGGGSTKISGSATSTGSFGSVHTAGNVGIGTSSPAGVLHAVLGSSDFRIDSGLSDTTSAANYGIGFDDAGSNGVFRLRYDRSAGEALSTSKLTFFNNGGGTGVFTIQQDGNVGIGTTSPSGKLHVLTTAGATALHIDGTGAQLDMGNFDSIATITSEAGSTGLRFKARGGNQPDFVVATSGNVGIATTGPAYTLDVDGNIGYEGSITDYSLRRLKEDIVEITGSGMIEKFKNVPLYRYRYKPKVTKEELKDLAFREFGEENDDGEWEWDRWDEIFPSGSGESKMWDCPDAELKTFLDEQAEELRAERRTDEYHQKQNLQLGLIADDEALAENFPEVLSYRQFDDEDRDDEIWGIKTTAYIGMLHGVIKELVGRVEALENA